MTEFTKTKMHFALALLGTLFALHPFVEKFEAASFDYPVLGNTVHFKVSYVFTAVAGLLAFTVYCYAIALLSEKPGSRMERLGNLTYAFAILVVPLYAALYLSSLLAEHVGEAHVALIAPATALGLIAIWLVLSYTLAWRLRRQDNQAKIEQLANQEIIALNRAPEMFDSNHYDLAVIEAWKALEARLRRVLLLRGYTRQPETAQKLIDRATRLGVVKEASRKLLEEVRQQWNIAVGTEPLAREGAETALTAARHVLATIPVERPA